MDENFRTNFHPTVFRLNQHCVFCKIIQYLHLFWNKRISPMCYKINSKSFALMQNINLVLSLIISFRIKLRKFPLALFVFNHDLLSCEYVFRHLNPLIQITQKTRNCSVSILDRSVQTKAIHPTSFKNVVWNVGLVCSRLNNFCACKVYPSTPKIVNSVAVYFFYIIFFLLINKCNSAICCNFLSEDNLGASTMQMFEISEMLHFLLKLGVLFAMAFMPIES